MSVKNDWTGYKYNTFEVLGEDKEYTKLCEERINKGELKRYNKKYLCKCECGNIVSVSVTQIAKNKPLSCGCKRICFAEDLTGQQFGDWTVLYRDFDLEDQKALQEITPHAYWKCRCVCGTEKSVMGRHLRSGASKGCGCKQADRISCAKVMDLRDLKFGKLTPIKRIKKQGKNWQMLCRCECGEQIVVPIYLLNSGKVYECKTCEANGFPSIKSYSVYKRTQDKIKEQGSLEDRLIEKYPNLNLQKFWSDKNTFQPCEITKKSHRQIYLVCPECGKEFTASALQLYERVYDIVCPDCLSKNRDSSYEKAVKDFLNNELHLETLHENRCNLKSVNPKTKSRLYYDNEIPKHKVIIEVNGIQHYKEIQYSFWLDGVSPKEWLQNLQERDEYKKNYAIEKGYKYIAISYKQILDGTYKQIIKNLLKEGEID